MIRIPFDPENQLFDLPIDAAESWLETMESRMEKTKSVDDMQKIGICLSNLRASPNYGVPKHGQFNSFEEFKAWFRQCIHKQNMVFQFEKRCRNTIQTGLFRDYYFSFKKIREENQQLNFVFSEQQMNLIFLQNMRNIALRKLLQQGGVKHFLDLIRLGEQMIRDGMVKDRALPTPGPPLGPLGLVPLGPLGLVSYGSLAPLGPPSLHAPLTPVSQGPLLVPGTLVGPVTLEADSDSRPALPHVGKFEFHPDDDDFIPGPPSYSPIVREAEPAKVPVNVTDVPLPAPSPLPAPVPAPAAVTEPAPEPEAVPVTEPESPPGSPPGSPPESPPVPAPVSVPEEPVHQPLPREQELPVFEKSPVFEPPRSYDVGSRDSYSDSGSDDRRWHDNGYGIGYGHGNGHSHSHSQNHNHGNVPTQIMLRSMKRYEEPRVSEDGWKYRFTLGDTECPLDTSSKDRGELADSAKSWLAEMEHRLSTLEFHSQEEQVLFCLHNLTGFVRKAANIQQPFKSYPRFKQWFSRFFDIPYEKRDVVGDLLSTTQTGTIEQYKLQFRNIHDENEFCQFPVSPQLIKEFFIRNLADGPVKAHINEGNYFGLLEVFTQLDVLLDLDLAPSTATSTTSVQIRKLGAIEKKQPKRPRDVPAPRRQARPVTSKSAAEVPVSASPLPPPPPPIHPGPRPLEERIQLARPTSRLLSRTREGSDELFQERLAKRVHFLSPAERHFE